MLPLTLLAAMMTARPVPPPPESPAVVMSDWQAPTDLQDAVRRLAVARERLGRTGEVRLRYTEAQLRAQAASGRIPNARFLVRLVAKDLRPTDPMGTLNASRHLPLWAATFEQLEAADSDPETITRLLGMPFDGKASYSLLIMTDVGGGAPMICPTFPAIADLAARDLATPDFPAELLREVVTPAYQQRYAELMTRFYVRGFKESIADDVERFALTDPALHDVEARKRFLARLRVHTQYGASDLFRGDGVTEIVGPDKRLGGVLELFVMDPAPKPIGAYERQGHLVKVPCVPLKKPHRALFLDPL